MTKQFIVAVNIVSDDIDSDGMRFYGDEDMFDAGEEGQKVMALSSKEKRSVITKEVLARRWGIGLDSENEYLSSSFGLSNDEKQEDVYGHNVCKSQVN
jgi:hypothetical protein